MEELDHGDLGKVRGEWSRGVNPEGQLLHSYPY